MNSNDNDTEYLRYFKCKAKDFKEFTEEIISFTNNYLEYIQKPKIFNLNVYKKMLSCFDNIRQTNENIEKCVSKEKELFQEFDAFLNNNYVQNSKFLDKCTDDCKGVEDIECLNNCGTRFKQSFHYEIDQYLKNI